MTGCVIHVDTTLRNTLSGTDLAEISARGLVSRPAVMKWSEDNGAVVDPCILHDPVALANLYRQFLEKRGKRELYTFLNHSKDTDCEAGNPFEKACKARSLP
jgi:hypothetical protein